MKFFLATSLIFSLLLSSKAQNIIITEIMYNPAESGSDSTEFIELYNNTSNPIEITGYYFEGVTFTFPSKSFPANTYLVIAEDADAFFNTYGVVADGDFGGALSNSGEDIVLRNATGQIIDSVNYDNVGDWPKGTDSGEPAGGGASIELCVSSSDNEQPENWKVSTTPVGAIINGLEVYATPGEANSSCDEVVTSTSYIYSFPIITYPNPVNDRIHINLSYKVPEAHLEILTLSGEVIMEERIVDSQHISLPFEEEKGLYLLKIYGDKHVEKTVKFVKL